MDIFLFDMDSVLVQPGGYREALIETINYFSRKFGLGELAPTPDEIEVIEAYGITSEWDSAPIAIAEMLRTHARPDYARLSAQVSAAWQSGEYPAEAAYRVLGGPDGQLDEWTTTMLLNSRTIERSEVMHVFQQFTLGDEFEAAYGLPRTLDAGSTLLLHDEPALGRPVPPNSAIYTARPCGAPRDVPPLTGFAPEAELGARLVGLTHLPLIGFGSFQWLAGHLGNGAVAEAWVKPSPVHALAAVAAALGEPESAAVIAAEAAARGQWQPSLAKLRAEAGRVFVFEDSARSIGGVRKAAHMLGPGWQCVGVGIAPGGPKREALQQVADRVYDTLNAAIDAEIDYNANAHQN